MKTSKNTADFEEEVVNKVSVTAMKGGEEIGREIGPVVQKTKQPSKKTTLSLSVKYLMTNS